MDFWGIKRRLAPYGTAPFVMAALLAMSFSRPGAAGQPMPIFDTHVHYSQGAWATYGPAAVFAAMDAAGVRRALVSSTPDDGTLRLYQAGDGRVVPMLRPYHDGLTPSNWTGSADVRAYLEERLAMGVHRGIGEIHLYDETAAKSPAVEWLAATAVARDLFVHVHTDAAPLRALLAIDSRLKVLWAHAGMSTPPAVIGGLLAGHPRLWTEVSFRGYDIAPGGKLDAAWRNLFVRHRDRFMVGTDTYVTGRWDAYGDLIEEHRRWLAQLPPDVGEAIAWGNAARLFGGAP